MAATIALRSSVTETAWVGEDAEIEQSLAQVGLVGVDDVASQQFIAGEDQSRRSCPSPLRAPAMPVAGAVPK